MLLTRYLVPGTVTTELVDYLVVYWHLELRMYNNHVLILVLPHISIISTGSNYVRLPGTGTRYIALVVQHPHASFLVASIVVV